MLVNGKWKEKWHPYQTTDSEGRFLRQNSSIRNWVTPGGSTGATGVADFTVEAGRYVLYVSYVCPWASRTLLALALKGLDNVIDVVVVEPVLTDQGWRFGTFPGATPPVTGSPTYLHELYTEAIPNYTGRATVPVLWDLKKHTIVNNESADIMSMFDRSFAPFADDSVELYPDDLAPAIDSLNADLYSNLNNGVYKAGFAKSQRAYNEAVTKVFDALDRMERRLATTGPYLFGDRITESDLRLFVTLVRFDVVYYSLFKCNLRRVSDYPFLSAYLERLLSLDSVASTVNLQHIKAGYYSIRALNPTGIVPAGPNLPWAQGMSDLHRCFITNNYQGEKTC